MKLTIWELFFQKGCWSQKSFSCLCNGLVLVDIMFFANLKEIYVLIQGPRSECFQIISQNQSSMINFLFTIVLWESKRTCLLRFSLNVLYGETVALNVH